MTEAAQKLLEEARKLPPEDQLWLADEFSLLVTSNSDLHPDWGDEIKRRLDEIDSGKVRMIPGEQVMDEMLQMMSPEARARVKRETARLAS